MTALSAGTLATEGWRLLGRERPSAIAWGLGYLALMALAIGGMFAVLGPSIGLLLSPQAAQAKDLDALLRMFGALGVVYGVLVPLSLLFQAVIMGAIYRAILRPEDKGFYYMRIGGDEGRLVLAYILLMLIAMLATTVAFAVVFGAVVAVPGTGWKVLTGIVGGVAGACFCIWLGVRLCLSTPMTFAERRVRLFGSFALTKGRFWPLLGGFFLSLVFVILVSTFAQLILGAAAMMSGGGIAALVQGGPPSVAALSALAPLGVVYVVVMAASGLFQGVLMLAPLAAAYRTVAIDGDPMRTAETFA